MTESGERAAEFEQLARKWYGEKLGFGSFSGNEVVGSFGQAEFFLLLADLVGAAFEAGRGQALKEIHAYQTKRMWDGAISFMKKDIPGYELAALPAPPDSGDKKGSGDAANEANVR